jgi:hypothetical protein
MTYVLVNRHDRPFMDEAGILLLAARTV